MFRLGILCLICLRSITAVSSYSSDNDQWKMGWFPNKPGEKDSNPRVNLNVGDTKPKNDTRQMPWFPEEPGVADTHPHTQWPDADAPSNDTWKGNWFPNQPNQPDTNNVVNISVNPKTTDKPEQHLNEAMPMVGPTTGLPHASNTYDELCNNGKINHDFDPKNASQLSSFVCQDDRQFYQPKYTTHPMLFEQTLPARYVGGVRCVDTPIEYEGIPMHGQYRPAGAQYGEYVYVPPQRWLNSMAAGAIVMLYHPCADATQVDILKHIVTHCLRRHVISASDLPSAERPLVLVAWGHRLEMSAVAQSVAVDFIRQHALRGVTTTARRRSSRPYALYDLLLVKSADVVSNESDADLCPNLV